MQNNLNRLTSFAMLIFIVSNIFPLKSIASLVKTQCSKNKPRTFNQTNNCC